jgi:threonine dehydratase
MISLDDVLRAHARLRTCLGATPLRRYAALDEEVGQDIEVWVKHENHLPTGSFKARTGLAAISALTPPERGAGIVAASRGNHGIGLAWAGMVLDTRVTICVPRGSHPESHRCMRGFFASVVEEGGDYAEAAARAEELARARGLTLVRASNALVAGAATITLEIIEQQPELDAIVFVVEGGAMALGGLTVLRALRPQCKVYAVELPARGAHRRHPRAAAALPGDIAGLVTVSDGEVAAAIRMLVRTTHNLADGGGAAGLAGLLKLRARLAGKTVAIVLAGANIDEATLARVLSGDVERASSLA